MRFIKKIASANIIYTGGLLKKTASDNNISTSDVLSRPPMKFHMRFFKQTASANIIYTRRQLKKTVNDNDAVGTYMRLNGFRRSRRPSIS
jgi:hypothetical protein